MRWVDQAGRKGLAIQGDIANREHCREIINQVVDEFGGIDILLNNAGYQTVLHDLADLTPEVLDRTFRINLFAMFWLSQAALEHMGPGSVILNTGSVQGLIPSGQLLAYAATKGAIHNFTRSLSQMVAERGIRVNAVAPGPVWTPLIVSTMPDDQVRKFASQSIWKRPAQPAEIAPSYVFLASSDARYYTGEVLAPTGEETTR